MASETGEDLIFRHFIRAVECHLADRRRQQGVSEQPSQQPGASTAVKTASSTVAQPKDTGTNDTPRLPCPSTDNQEPPPQGTPTQADSVPNLAANSRREDAMEHTTSKRDAIAAGAKGAFNQQQTEESGRPVSEAEQRMQFSIGSMFEAGAGVAGPGVDPRSAAAGAKQVASQLGDESLAELLMAWYYAGYTTGVMKGKRQ